MEANELNTLAQKAAEGIQPTKEQLDSMTMAGLWKFTKLVEKLKQVKEGTSRRMQQLDMLRRLADAGKKFGFKSDDGKNWTLTPHAIHRFLERCNDVDSCYDLVGLLKKDLTNPPCATENKLDLLFSRMSHREEAECRFGSCTGLLYAVVSGHIVKTVHRNESKRWKLANC